MRIDPYKHKERYLNWKEEVSKKGISDISEANSDLTLRYLHDMEHGINIANKNSYNLPMDSWVALKCYNLYSSWNNGCLFRKRCIK